MKTFIVTIPERYAAAYGAEIRVRAVYFKKEDEGSLSFFETSSETRFDPIKGKYYEATQHWLAGGDLRAAPKLMVNEFPAGFWSSVTEAA